MSDDRDVFGTPKNRSKSWDSKKTRSPKKDRRESKKETDNCNPENLINNTMEEFDEYLTKKQLNESSLSRVWKHNEEHDCGALTAFRKGESCGEGTPYSNNDNKKRNRSLLSKLKSKGYGVTTLHGSYPEGGKTTKEISYFVVDLHDAGSLEKDIKSLGTEFEQDSILFIPKGAIKGDTKAYLIGTNTCENNWLGLGKTEVFNKGRMGYDSPIYTSRVNGRPFIFEEVGKEVSSPASGMGMWAMHLVSEKDWREIDI